MDFHWTFPHRTIQKWSGSSEEEADPLTGWTDSKPAPREEAPDWSAIHGRGRARITARPPPLRRLDCFNFPHARGANILPSPEDAWREKRGFFLGGGAIQARSLDIREGGRTHVEFVSEVAASGESAVLSTSAFAIQMRRRES